MSNRGAIEAYLHLLDEAFRGAGIEETQESQAFLPNLASVPDEVRLILPQGASRWEIAGVGFPEALMVDLQIVPEQRVLVAATHGLGIFYLNLPKLGTPPGTPPR